MIASKFALLANTFVSWFLQVWLAPWLWISLAVVLATMALIGPKPIVMSHREESGALNIAALHLRQLSWIALLMMLIGLPLAVFGFGCAIYRPRSLAHSMLDQLLHQGFIWWDLPVAAWLAALLSMFCWSRYARPHLSALSRRLRVRQTGEELSDIRVERDQLRAKQFMPTKLYSADEMFFGVDASGEPIRLKDDHWRTTHMKIIGPTQTGKGVLLGVLADQIIAKGYTLVVIDPKPDKHLKHIMQAACARTGRRFMEIDLNDGSRHRWAPFAGGSQRDRRSRLMYAFGMQDTGESADYYKSGERSVLDRLLNNWSGDLGALRNLIVSQKMEERMSRTLNYVNEWLAVPTFSPPKGRGFSIEKVLTEGGVAWVRSSLFDQLVIRAATIFLMEVQQEAFRLYRNVRKHHLTLMVDEVKFMVSDMLANALASVAGVDMNMILAYQSVLDLRAIRDKSVNVKAIEESINVNCKLTLCYQAANHETAEWASRMSGTVQKAVTRMETLKVGRFGTEQWEDHRMVSRQEVPLIPENVMLTLPERVGVLFRPNHLAEVLYTAWVPVSMPLEVPVISNSGRANSETCTLTPSPINKVTKRTPGDDQNAPSSVNHRLEHAPSSAVVERHQSDEACIDDVIVADELGHHQHGDTSSVIGLDDV